MANKDADISKIKETSAKEATTKPEKIEVPVKVEIEKIPEIPRPPEVPKEKIEEGVKRVEIPIAPAPAVPAAPVKSPVLEKIEDVLEEDLQDIYFQMPSEKQAEFAKKGEETALKIEVLLRQVKVKVNKILQLIIKWLKLIPGINRYFLEQEAKIKTDKILKIKEESEGVSRETQNKI